MKNLSSINVVSAHTARDLNAELRSLPMISKRKQENRIALESMNMWNFSAQSTAAAIVNAVAQSTCMLHCTEHFGLAALCLRLSQFLSRLLFFITLWKMLADERRRRSENEGSKLVQFSKLQNCKRVDIRRQHFGAIWR
jgi:hypothetical protein